MKYMKLGSKPDSFQTDGNNMRYVPTELATDIVVHVGDVKFYLHKFPLLSKSARLQKLVSSANEGNGNSDEVHIHDIPGSYSAFEICAKFCYGMTVTLNAYNVVAVRCAAEYLEMYEIMDKGNLIFKVDVFMNSSIFRSWKDSIIVLQTTKSLLPFSEELKLTGHCIDAVASKASVAVSKVEWSYTYNRKKIPDENGNDPSYNGVRSRMVPNDWWVEDLCELEIDLYKRVIITLKNKGVIPNEVIGDALKAYAYRKLPSSSSKGVSHNDISKYQTILNTIVSLLPTQKNSVSCSFLLKLLKAAISVDSGEAVKDELVKRIGQQLEEASVNDLLFRAQEGETAMYDVHLVHKILKEFRTHGQNAEIEMENGSEIEEDRNPGNGILSEASKLMVAKLVDNYLAEIAKDPNLPLAMFISIAEMVSSFSRPSHDVLYRAIDAYLKEHPGISKSERKRICLLMDCKKLSAEMCMHAVQNERLPLRVVVQVLFFEQVRAAASSGSSTPDLPKAIKDLNCGSYGSSRSVTTNNDEDWDAVASAAELRALRGELAGLRLGNGAVQDRNAGDNKISNTDKAIISKMKGLIMSKKILSKISSRKGVQAENSGSDSSESLGSTNHDETKVMATGKGRHSVS